MGFDPVLGEILVAGSMTNAPATMIRKLNGTTLSGPLRRRRRSTSSPSLIHPFEQNLARPRLRLARGIRQFDSAERGATGFSGLAYEIDRVAGIRRGVVSKALTFIVLRH
jgi:hypothetical protein